MRKIFTKFPICGTFELSADDAHHVLVVLRHTVGDCPAQLDHRHHGDQKSDERLSRECRKESHSHSRFNIFLSAYHNPTENASHMTKLAVHRAERSGMLKMRISVVKSVNSLLKSEGR